MKTAPSTSSRRRRQRCQQPPTASDQLRRLQPNCFHLAVTSFNYMLYCVVGQHHESALFSASFHFPHRINRPVFQRKFPSDYPKAYHDSPDQRESWRKSSIGDDEGEESIESDVNGLYLDEETYLQAQDTMIRPDGSLDLGQRESMVDDPLYPPTMPRIKNDAYQLAVEGLFSPAPSYSYYEEEDGKNDHGQNQQPSNSQTQPSDEQRLRQVAAEIDEADDIRQSIDAETLHQQVFAEEQAHLRQSGEFRKSLSSLRDSDGESLAAKQRREAVEQYNESVLDGLMREIDAMEEMSISRGEAVRLAREEGQKQLKQKNEVRCIKCGCVVSPDTMQWQEMIRKSRKRVEKEGVQVRKSNAGFNGILCQECYGQQFRRTDEARVRLGAGSYGEPSHVRMFSKGEEYSGREESGRARQRGDGDKKERMSRIRGIDTSSLFDLTKGYDVTKGRQRSSDTSKPPINPNKYTPKKSIDSERRTPPRLGGRVLAKRMKQDQELGSIDGDQHHYSESMLRDDDDLSKQHYTPRFTRGRTASSSSKTGNRLDGKAHHTPSSQSNSISNTEGDQQTWVRVEDPDTGRMFYWNTETGEMKRTLD